MDLDAEQQVHYEGQAEMNQWTRFNRKLTIDDVNC